MNDELYAALLRFGWTPEKIHERLMHSPQPAIGTPEYYIALAAKRHSLEAAQGPVGVRVHYSRDMVAREHGRKGGRPNNKPSSVSILARYEAELLKQVSNDGTARAALTRDLASECGVTPQTARNWVRGAEKFNKRKKPAPPFFRFE